MTFSMSPSTLPGGLKKRERIRACLVNKAGSLRSIAQPARFANQSSRKVLHASSISQPHESILKCSPPGRVVADFFGLFRYTHLAAVGVHGDVYDFGFGDAYAVGCAAVALCFDYDAHRDGG